MQNIAPVRGRGKLLDPRGRRGPPSDMSDDLRARADARLDAALATSAVRDPRPYLRPALKHLKERDAGAFARALEHYETTLVPAVAADADPLAAWLEYGAVVASLVGDGRVVMVDGTGRARAAEAPGSGASGDALLLHLPDAAEAPAVVLRCPRQATAAQEATIDLLVIGRVSVPG